MNRRVGLVVAALAVASFVSASTSARAAETLSKSEAEAALRKAVAFFREKVAIEGGYLYRYSEDLALREGEGKATATTAWVQPPGTPSVGEAFLLAYERTGDKYYLDAAVETARALVKGQLASGGWDYRIEFAPQERKKYAFRAGGPADAKARNTSTLDDDNTQAAVRLLIHVDRALGFKDAAIHEAAAFALESLLQAQYTNGAWPQRYAGPPNAADFPVLKASYPADWPRTFPAVNYSSTTPRCSPPGPASSSRRALPAASRRGRSAF